MKKKIQVFISSTYTDLIEERQAAVSAILKAGHIPAGMELFTAGDESQMETIKRWIDESDVFMLILGGRYGSIETATSLSYTELEYDYAVNTGKPYFAVVIEESALERKVREKGISVIETENAKQLAAFRQKVLSRTSAFYRDTRDISLAVYETISDFLVRYDFKGWVSGGEIPDIQSFTEQINRLREENKRLSEEKAALHEAEVFSASEDKEFRHIQKMLSRSLRITVTSYQNRLRPNLPMHAKAGVYETDFLTSIIKYVGKGYDYFDYYDFGYVISGSFDAEYSLSDPINPAVHVSNVETAEDVTTELQKYGLIKHTRVVHSDRTESAYEFTEKMHRFNYWLEFNGHSFEKISFELVEESKS